MLGLPSYIYRLQIKTPDTNIILYIYVYICNSNRNKSFFLKKTDGISSYDVLNKGNYSIINYSCICCHSTIRIDITNA